MSNVTIGQLTAASAVSTSDLLELEQTENGQQVSRKATVSQIAAAGVYRDVTNITVYSTDWTIQSPADMSGYPYVATISINGVTTSDIAEVVPSLAAIEDGKLCPLNQTVANGVRIYTSQAPASDYVIDRVSIRGASI